MNKKQFSCQDGASGQFELLRWLLWLRSCTQCSWLLFRSVLIQQWWLERGKWWSSDKSFFILTVLILGKHHCPLCHRPSELGEHLFHERNPSITQVSSAALPPLSRGLCAVALGRWIWQVPTGQKCTWICRNRCVWGLMKLCFMVWSTSCGATFQKKPAMSWAEQGSAPSLPRPAKCVNFLSKCRSGLLGNDSSVCQGIS